MATDPATLLANNLGSIIAAVAGLGTASMGLVDATKAFAGGPSNFGFGHIKNSITHFLPAAGAPLSSTAVLAALKANWVNGVPKADQKAKAKALIHLRLTPTTAPALGTAAGVDGTKLKSLADKIASGTAAMPEEINVLGQFDAVLSAVLDDAYERGDQIYRNRTKLLATIVSTILGLVGGWLIGGASENILVGLIVGIIATPLAPVSKDLASSLQSAVTAVQAVRRGVR